MYSAETIFLEDLKVYLGKGETLQASLNSCLFYNPEIVCSQAHTLWALGSRKEKDRFGLAARRSTRSGELVLVTSREGAEQKGQKSCGTARGPQKLTLYKTCTSRVQPNSQPFCLG